MLTKRGGVLVREEQRGDKGTRGETLGQKRIQRAEGVKRRVHLD